MNDDQKWKLMRLVVPPATLAAIIARVQDGTISNASAKIVFNKIYEQNLAKLMTHLEAAEKIT